MLFFLAYSLGFIYFCSYRVCITTAPLHGVTLFSFIYNVLFLLMLNSGLTFDRQLILYCQGVPSTVFFEELWAPA